MTIKRANDGCGKVGFLNLHIALIYNQEMKLFVRKQKKYFQLMYQSTNYHGKQYDQTSGAKSSTVNRLQIFAKKHLIMANTFLNELTNIEHIFGQKVFSKIKVIKTFHRCKMFYILVQYLIKYLKNFPTNQVDFVQENWL